MGGAGNDDIHGRTEDDILNGNEGHDTMMGGDGRDVIDGAAGHDDIWGDAGHDLLRGGDGDDRLCGRAGKDTLDGGAGNDTLWGGANPDVFLFSGAFGDDIVRGYGNGGKFEDTFVFSAAYFSASPPPDAADFIDTYLSPIDDGATALINLTDLGGGTVRILGTPGETFNLDAFAEDLVFL